MLPQILQPTRVTDHSATVIDNIFTNATNFETISGNILNQIADHFSQFFILRKINANYKNSAYHQYDYSNFNKDNFLTDFSKIDWSDSDSIGDTHVNKKFFNFQNKVSKCVREHVPPIKLSRKKLSLRSKPWITPKIEYMMAKRDKYLRTFNITKNLDMEYLYKKFRNKVVSEICGSKNGYYEQYFTKHKSNMKMLWSGIRSIINCKSNVGSNISCLHHDGIKVDDSRKMTNIFNNVFVNTAHKINEKICCTRKSP